MARSTWTDLLDPDEATLGRSSRRGPALRSLRNLLRPAEETAPASARASAATGLRPGDPARGGRRPRRGSRLLPGGRLRPDAQRHRDRPQDAREPPAIPAGTRRATSAISTQHELPPGQIAFHLVDDVAERFLDLLDDVDEEIDELEENIDRWPAEKTRRRLSELRHDLLHIRKTLAPDRDAVREIVDGRVDVEGRRPFSKEVFPGRSSACSQRPTTGSCARPNPSSTHATCFPRPATTSRLESRSTRTRSSRS